MEILTKDLPFPDGTLIMDPFNNENPIGQPPAKCLLMATYGNRRQNEP